MESITRSSSVVEASYATVLVCGANGFIGRALCAALTRKGHAVIKGVRRATRADEIEVDYANDTDPSLWLPRLSGIDVVINAVGILVERGEQRFDCVHHRTPIALFEAARMAGVRHIVQISALGAQTGKTAYFASKRAADEHLQALPVVHHVLRPALVYGPDGASSRFFRAIAASPVHVLPGGGRQWVRPIHIDELAEMVARLVEAAQRARDERPAACFISDDRSVLDLVGATRLEYRDMLATYRASMAWRPAWRIDVPAKVIDAAAALLDRVPGSMLTRDTWRMLQMGSTADVETTIDVLGRVPLGIESFITPREGATLRLLALGLWRSLWLRIALAIVWIGSALCSTCLYPKAASLDLLARVHLHGMAALVTLYLSSAADAVLGVLTLVHPGRRLWILQAALIIAYSAIVAVMLPEALIHPLGPILKNVPILAVLVTLISEETRP